MNAGMRSKFWRRFAFLQFRQDCQVSLHYLSAENEIMTWTSIVGNAIASFSQGIVKIAGRCSRCIVGPRIDPCTNEVLEEEVLESTAYSKEEDMLALDHGHKSIRDETHLNDSSCNEAEKGILQRPMNVIKLGNLGTIDLESPSPTLLEPVSETEPQHRFSETRVQGLGQDDVKSPVADPKWKILTNATIQIVNNETPAHSHTQRYKSTIEEQSVCNRPDLRYSEDGDVGSDMMDISPKRLPGKAKTLLSPDHCHDPSSDDDKMDISPQPIHTSIACLRGLPVRNGVKLTNCSSWALAQPQNYCQQGQHLLSRTHQHSSTFGKVAPNPTSKSTSGKQLLKSKKRKRYNPLEIEYPSDVYRPLKKMKTFQ